MVWTPSTGKRSARRRFWHRCLSILTAWSLFLSILPPPAFTQVRPRAAVTQSQPMVTLGAALGATIPLEPPTLPQTSPPVQVNYQPPVTTADRTVHEGQPPNLTMSTPPEFTALTAPPPASGQALNAAEVQKLIDAALKDHDEKKKKADEEKKKTEEEKKKAEAEDWYPVGSKLGMTAVWNHGVWLETAQKDFRFHVGGCVQYDMALYSPDRNLEVGPHNVGDFNDGVNLRRGRLRAEGTMWEVVDFRFELEFFNGVTPPGAAPDSTLRAQLQSFATPGPTDAWITVTQLPIIGNVRIGNQKEPIGLDHLESFRFLPFMERSPLFDFLTATAFNNGFTPGILVFDTALDERMTWAIGGFKNSYDVYGFGLGDGDWVATGRLTALPWYEQDGTYLLHLGIAGSHRDPIQNQVRYRVRTSERNAPAPLTPFVNVLIDTGFFNTTSSELMGLEAFMNIGPLTIQAEWQAAWNQNSSTAATGPLGTTFFHGYYVQALYWLTGEHTRWDKKAAAPDRPIPNSPFFWVPGQSCWCCSPGAWQVGIRYSQVDLNNNGINGGTLDDLTLGLNWILTPNAKLQWNYGWEHRGGFTSVSNGNVQAFGMRMQVDF